jgi:hypothetical protein
MGTQSKASKNMKRANGAFGSKSWMMVDYIFDPTRDLHPRHKRPVLTPEESAAFDKGVPHQYLERRQAAVWIKNPRKQSLMAQLFGQHVLQNYLKKKFGR